MPAQYVDPAVSRRKFEREISEYRQLEADYRKRGWLLIEADYPRVLVLLAAPQLTPPAIVTGVLFDYTNYDAEAPSVQLVHPFSGIPYAAKDLPTSLNRSIGGLQQIALPGLPAGAIRLNQISPLMQAHSPEDVPFLCIAGVREYHEHPGHTADAWELHRAGGAGRLVRLLDVIDRYGVQPIRRYSIRLTPEVGGFEAPEAPE